METAELLQKVRFIESVPAWDAYGNFVYPCNQPSFYAPPMPQQLPPGVPQGCYRGVPEGPPGVTPGLVRVTPPVPAPIHRITNDEVTLFSDIVGYFETGVDDNGYPVLIDLTCQICHCRTLEMPRNVAPAYPADDMAEGLAVLPCGHMFGMECLDRWVSTRLGAQENPCCPMCRFELVYSGEYCNHVIPINPYDNRVKRHRQIPLTLPEGGYIQNCCTNCTWEQISEGTQRISDLLFPNAPPGDFTPVVGYEGPRVMRESAAGLLADVYKIRGWTETHCRFW